MITAYYGTRKGGSGVRPIKDAAEAEKILRGGYGATHVRLEASDGTLIGERRRTDYPDDRRVRWFWSFDEDAFKTPSPPAGEGRGEGL